jgi:hypothetical protein
VGLGIGLQYLPLIGAGTPCNNANDCGFTGTSPPQVCEQHKACVAPGGSPAGAPGCSPLDSGFCPTGTLCQTIGVCAVSGGECAGIGSACPGGVAGDTCRDPPTTCYSAMPVCNPDSYARLAVDISDLPGAAPGFMRSLGLRRPSGQTPIGQAAVGALNNLRARLAAMPRRKAALIIATDGLPAGCGNQDIPTIADSLYTARNSSPSVPTYVIGVLDQADLVQGQSDFAQLAAAGGSREPFILSPNGDLTRKLQDTLAQIRGELACEYVIPEEKKGMIDFDKVNLSFTIPGATPVSVPYVAAANRCDATQGGWYYDVDPKSGGTPARVVACDATCRRYRGASMVQAQLLFGCKTVVIQ